jgi:hypothetical protein
VSDAVMEEDTVEQMKILQQIMCARTLWCNSIGAAAELIFFFDSGALNAFFFSKLLYYSV